MVLHSSDSPPLGNLAMLAERLAAPDPGIEGARKLEVAQPQEIYVSTTDALLRGLLLKEASPSAWQYMLIADNEPAGVAEVSKGPDDDVPRSFDIVHSAEYAAAMNETVTLAEALPGQYKFRILRVPNVYLLAVWLSSPGGELLLPVRPVPTNLEGARIFTEAALTDALVPLATQRRETVDYRSEADLLAPEGVARETYSEDVIRRDE